MNFMQKCKRNGGFTLVELIVVIAILAILAGVAVPAYTGYIKKAEEAADQQLLGAVNTAFAAACLEEGQDSQSIAAANISLKPAATEGKVVDAIISVASKTAGVKLDSARIDAAFKRYYAGNEGGVFKNIEGIGFDPETGTFKDVKKLAEEGKTVAVVYNGIAINVSAAAAQTLIDSTFMNAATLGGSAGLLDKVNSVTGMAAGMAGSLEEVFKDDTFQQTAMNALGVSTEQEYKDKQAALVAELIAKNPGMSPTEAANQLSANAAVLYASQSAMNMSKDDINALFSTTGVETIKTNLKGANTTDGMAQAALVYGMYTAYANSEEYGSAELQSNTDNALTVLNALDNDENFKKYVNSAQGQTDLNAYLNTLGMINDSAMGNPTAVEHLMVNGFNNQAMKDMVASVTGGK